MSLSSSSFGVETPTNKQKNNPKQHQPTKKKKKKKTACVNLLLDGLLKRVLTCYRVCFLPLLLFVFRLRLLHLSLFPQSVRIFSRFSNKSAFPTPCVCTFFECTKGNSKCYPPDKTITSSRSPTDEVAITKMFHSPYTLQILDETTIKQQTDRQTTCKLNSLSLSLSPEKQIKPRSYLIIFSCFIFG